MGYFSNGRHPGGRRGPEITLFAKRQQERELLRLLARGEKEMETGKGYDLKDVMKEADKLLERMEV
jgi:hypothetical protein